MKINLPHWHMAGAETAFKNCVNPPEQKPRDPPCHEKSNQPIQQANKKSCLIFEKWSQTVAFTVRKLLRWLHSWLLWTPSAYLLSSCFSEMKTLVCGNSECCFSL